MINTGESPSKGTINDDFIRLLEGREAGLFFYSPYSFLREIDQTDLCRTTFTYPIKNEILAGRLSVSVEDIDGLKTWFVWKTPAWDSDYFRRKVVRIEFILPDHKSPEVAGLAISKFAKQLAGAGGYISVNIPCEDLLLIRSMSYSCFRLVETRLNYYFNGFGQVSAPEDPVRMAVPEDIPALKEVAMKMRNRFDRVHADPAFSDDIADAYLGRFIEESVKGFADMVMVPDIKGVKPFGFLAADHPVETMGLRIAKLVLAAADNSHYKGWLSKLLSAVIFELKKKNTDILTTITQAANRPAIRTWEKAGFRLGFVTHLYSYHND